MKYGRNKLRETYSLVEENNRMVLSSSHYKCLMMFKLIKTMIRNFLAPM